ncbi:hypothetical protein C8R43DRAFT_949269 [Mycena crocata]|nr:hypothetical protein C8R43DRAFT_949269 [Mycena crocata]
MEPVELPFYPVDFTVYYLTTEDAVNSALEGIIDGVVGFDTEFVKRDITSEERFVEEVVANLSGGHRKSGIVAWQAMERRMGIVPYVWDKMGLCTIQIARGDEAWIINLRGVQAYPRELRRILTSDAILKVGVGLLSDISVVWNDLRSDLSGLVDCGLMAKLLFAERYPTGAFQNLSMDVCAADVLGFRLDKSLQSGLLLTDAATDAIVALRLYGVLTGLLEERSVALDREIPFGWYSFGSRMGEAVRLKKTIRGFRRVDHVIFPLSSCIERLGLMALATIQDLSDVLLLRCFLHFFGSDQDDFVSFIKARHVACGVDSRWRTIVGGTPSLWKRVLLSQQVTVEALRFWLTNSGSEQIDVEIVFRDLEIYYRFGAPSTRICQYTRSVLPDLLDTVGRWASFTMNIEDVPCARLLVLALRGCLAASLVTLSMECSSLISMPPPPAVVSIFDYHPFYIFSAAPCRISILSLKSAAVGWMDPGCFRHLTQLEICGQGSSGVLRSSDLYMVLKASIWLERLSLGTLLLLEDVIPENVSVSLPLLRTLEMVFGVSGGFGPVVASLDLPILCNVVLTLDGPDPSDFLACLRNDSLFFAGVEKLVIRTGLGDPVCWRSAAPLFQYFPSVDDLDLANAAPFVFRMLMKSLADEERDPTARGALCPKMQSLSLGSGVMDIVKEFVDLRIRCMSARSLSQLKFFFVDTDEEYAAYSRDDWRALVLYVMVSTFIRFPPSGRLPVYETDLQYAAYIASSL